MADLNIESRSMNSLIYEFLELRISFLIHFVIWNEFQGCAVDAESDAAFILRTISKEMTKVSITGLASDFNSMAVTAFVIVH